MARIARRKEVCLAKCGSNGQSSIFSSLCGQNAQLEWDSHGARAHWLQAVWQASRLTASASRLTVGAWRKN